MGIEIERKFIVSKEKAAEYDSLADEGKYGYHEIEQAYLTTEPVIRVRKTDDKYSMTYKGKGLLQREEYNLPLTKEAYETLVSKADGNVIRKRRIIIPFDKYIIELDIFKEPFDSFIIAEVEFDSVDIADSFTPPEWFLEEVTNDSKYHNSHMSRMTFKKGENHG